MFDHDNEIYEKAKSQGATPEELELLLSTLDKYTFFSSSHPYWEGARVVERQTNVKTFSGFHIDRRLVGGELNIDRLLVKIRDLAECFATEDLKAFFLGAFRDRVKQRNGDGYNDEELALFNVKWPQYFPEGPKQAPAKQEPITKVLALRLYFLYWAGYLPKLDEGKGKKAGLAAIAEKEGVSPGSLINAWYAINKNSDKNPLKLSILEVVLPTLSDFPEAQKLAEEQLEQLKKKSNP